MQLYQWTDALKTDNAKIDSDHKMIIEKAQELGNAMADGKGKEYVTETVDFLQEYVKKHFLEEEMIQKSTNYPEFELHKKNHSYFISQLDQLAKKIRHNPSSTVNVLELNQLISGWFFNHIKKLDMDVAKHITKIK